MLLRTSAAKHHISVTFFGDTRMEIECRVNGTLDSKNPGSCRPPGFWFFLRGEESSLWLWEMEGTDDKDRHLAARHILFGTVLQW